MSENMKMNDEQVTPALLRADAGAMRRLAELYSALGDRRLADAPTRVATVLEEQAVRLEAGERVCRWVRDPNWPGFRDCARLRHLSPTVYCPACGGRVVLGDGEAGR
jgi:hypothetical protein